MSKGYAKRKPKQKEIIRLTAGQRSYLKMKRLLDVSCSLIALTLLSPVFLFVAILIKLDGPGEKVLFRQQRIGLNGEAFWLYKFRSMKGGSPELSTKEFQDAESYITRSGRWIRKTSLDELPQLWCTLIGTMSLVGPRPLLEREDNVHFLRDNYGIYQLRPGITGLAQISGRDGLSDYEKVWLDCQYVRGISCRTDLKILFRTVKSVLKADGNRDGCSSNQNEKERVQP